MKLGESVARLLAGAWRESPPPAELPAEDVERLTPHLLATGAAGLAWWRIRCEGPLADARRLHVLSARQQEARLRAALEACEAAGIEPILIKGWDVARRYPAAGLRPYGDVDLVVRAADLRAASALFPPGGPALVDLHHKHVRASRIAVDDLFAASRTIEGVRVLSPEHDLHLLAVHFLSSGGWRPLSLCDVALATETRPRDFDWDRALGVDVRRRSWTLTALGLARDLLGADVDGTPAAGHPVPGWVTAHVTEAFARLPVDNLAVAALRPTLNPRALAGAAAERWPPDPLRVNVLRGGRIIARPPRGLQVYDLAARAARALRPTAGRG
jgi:hypothetical protein